MNIYSKYALWAKQAYSDELIYDPQYTAHFLEDEHTDTQCHVLCNRRTQIVIFRGTEQNYKDIKTDLKFKMKNGMHEGFNQAYNGIARKYTDFLITGRLTIFIGHSLGGALALIAGSFYPSAYKKIVTFGAPRVFSEDQAETFDSWPITNEDTTNGTLTLRFENKADPVPYLPPYTLGYRHVGKTVYLTDSQPVVNPNPIGPFLSFFTSSLKSKLEAHTMGSYIEKINKLYT